MLFGKENNNSWTTRIAGHYTRKISFVKYPQYNTKITFFSILVAALQYASVTVTDRSMKISMWIKISGKILEKLK